MSQRHPPEHVQRIWMDRGRRAAEAACYRMKQGHRRPGAEQVAYDTIVRQYAYQLRLACAQHGRHCEA